MSTIKFQFICDLSSLFPMSSIGLPRNLKSALVEFDTLYLPNLTPLITIQPMDILQFWIFSAFF
jgi:hypothetical protein